MLKHYGFSCWVSCEGRPLPVYVEEAQENMKSAWITSEVGKHFSVSWQDNSGKRIATSGHVFVDGKDVASAIIRPGRSMPVERFGVKKNARSIKPFKFSELTLTDDDSLANMYDNTLKDVGTIRVEISRVQLGDSMHFDGYDAQNLGYVHEKAKKAGAHCTSFGEEKFRGTRTVAVSTSPYDPNEPGPYVTFTFRYRSRELLKANGIISSQRDNPRKRPSEDEEVIEIESDEEPLPSSPLRQENREDLSSPSKKVKSEHAIPDEFTGTAIVEERHISYTEGTTADEGNDSEGLPSSSNDEQVKMETEGVEEKGVDVLANDNDDDNETISSRSPLHGEVDHLIPPISSSPGPETLKDEEDELDD